MSCSIELRPLDKEVDYDEEKEPVVAEELSDFEKLSDETLAEIHPNLLQPIMVCNLESLVNQWVQGMRVSIPDDCIKYPYNLGNEVHQQLCARVLRHPDKELACRWIGQVWRKGKRFVHLVVDVSEHGKPLCLHVFNKKYVSDEKIFQMPLKSPKLEIVDYSDEYPNLVFKNPTKRTQSKPREKRDRLDFEGGDLSEGDLEVAGISSPASKKARVKSSEPFDVKAFLETDAFRKHALDYVSEMKVPDLVRAMNHRGVDLFSKLKKHCNAKSRAEVMDPSLIQVVPRRELSETFDALPDDVVLKKGREYNAAAIYYIDVKQDDWRKAEPDELPNGDQELRNSIPRYENIIRELEREIKIKQEAYNALQKELGAIDKDNQQMKYRRQNNICNAKHLELEKLNLQLSKRKANLDAAQRKLSGEDVGSVAGAGKRFTWRHTAKAPEDKNPGFLYLYNTEDERARALSLCLSKANPRTLFTGLKRCNFYLYRVIVEPFGACLLLTYEKPMNPEETSTDFYIHKKTYVNSLLGNVGILKSCKLAFQRKFLLDNYKLPIAEFARNFSDEMKRVLTFGGRRLSEFLSDEERCADKVILPEFLYPEDCGDMRHCLCDMKCLDKGTVVSGLDRRHVSREELAGVELPSTYKQVLESLRVEWWFKDKDTSTMGESHKRLFASRAPKR